MPLSRQQSNQLIAAGAVPIPPYFPEPGRLTRVRSAVGGPVVSIEQINSFAQVTRYFVQVAEAQALLKTKEKTYDPEKSEWFFGQDARDHLEKILHEEGPDDAKLPDPQYGVVFVREGAGVLVQVDRAISAGEVASMRSPCEGRDRCEG